MIIDAHTHVFPEAFLGERARLLEAESVFGELYASPRADMATAAGLLRAMDEDGVDHAVICGFAWRDADRCRRHNDALLEAASESGGRLSVFCCLPFTAPDDLYTEAERCAALGARGFGELRPEQLGVDIARDPRGVALGEVMTALGLPVMFHASEPVGHDYPGKDGQSIASLWAWLSHHPNARAVLAHLGGGLPFYAHMPEVAALFERVWVDTAAIPWLYQLSAVRAVIDVIGVERVLLGSDFPLRRPRRDLTWLSQSGLSGDEMRRVTGLNAARLLGLDS